MFFQLQKCLITLLTNWKSRVFTVSAVEQGCNPATESQLWETELMEWSCMRAKYKLMQSSHHLLCSVCRLNFKHQHLSGSRAALLCLRTVLSRQTWPTQEQQFHLSGRLLSVFSEVLVNHFGPLRGSLVFGTHRAAHGSARTTRLPQTSSGGGERRRSPARMPSGCATNGRVVPVSTEAQTQPWAEFWPTWLKSQRRSSVRLQRWPGIIWRFDLRWLRPCGHARRRLSRIHPCAEAPARCGPGGGRTETAGVGDSLTVLPARGGADVTRATCPDSPIKSWRDAHVEVLVLEPIKVEAGYGVETAVDATVVPQQMRHMFQWRQRASWKDGWAVRGNVILYHKEERNGECLNHSRGPY